ncbi:uncharacterized protein LOC143372036 [Andrena cerasifolii]|uniref:uncharacterized protein LOC143372036 n=1 Tax=Andrena cerasifolii TaxID=2819439 RepID=UPI0040378760
MFIVENKENEESQTDMAPIEQDMASASVDELDEEIVKVFGEDPTLQNPKEIELDNFLTSRWNSWLASGLRKEVKELLKKHSRKGNCNLEALELNPEIVPSLNESSQKRDKHFLLTQNLAGSGLSALGWLFQQP